MHLCTQGAAHHHDSIARSKHKWCNACVVAFQVSKCCCTFQLVEMVSQLSVLLVPYKILAMVLNHLQGYTALHFAAMYGHAEAMALLLSHGADPNAARQVGLHKCWVLSRYSISGKKARQGA